MVQWGNYLEIEYSEVYFSGLILQVITLGLGSVLLEQGGNAGKGSCTAYNELTAGWAEQPVLGINSVYSKKWCFTGVVGWSFGFQGEMC